MNAQPTLLEAIRTQQKLDAARILDCLAEYHNGADWVFFRELRTGTGYREGSDQRIDAWAMHLWPSQHLKRIAYEIKVSRGDFLHELKQPQKRKLALLWSNQFYFVTPANLVNPSELPPECGLVEIGDDGSFVNHRVAAPWRDTPAPSWRLLASIARRVKDGRVG